MLERLINYAKLMRLDKPIGTLLLAWPTLWALWLAALEKDLFGEWTFSGVDPKIVIVFLIGVFLMRSAGCVINDFADRNIDKHVKRTSQRPLTTGQISTKKAIALFLILALLAFSLLFTLDERLRFTIILWSVPALLTAVAYPFMKRFFATPQLVLGIAFSFAIPMAFAAYGHSWDIWFPVTLLVIANLTWVVAYDTQYAMVDRSDDVKIGVKSTAVFFGTYDKLAIAALQVLSFFALMLLGQFYSLNHYYFFLVILGSGFFIYQQFLIKDRNGKKCFSAFLNNTWFGACVWLAILLGISPN